MMALANEVRPLREWRDMRFLTLEELAQQAGLSIRTVWDMEHGNRPPRAKTVRAVAKALGIEPGQIAEAVK